MLSERLKSRLRKDRPTASVTVRIPLDVIESMKPIARRLGLHSYQTLIKSYLGEGLRRDETLFTVPARDSLIEALKRHGVPHEVIEQAKREATVAGSSRPSSLRPLG